VRFGGWRNALARHHGVLLATGQVASVLLAQRAVKVLQLSKDGRQAPPKSFQGTLRCGDQYLLLAPRLLLALPAEVQVQVREQVHEAAEPFRSGMSYDLPAVCLNVVTR
jgi:hypothetical protein